MKSDNTLTIAFTKSCINHGKTFNFASHYHLKDGCATGGMYLCASAVNCDSPSKCYVSNVATIELSPDRKLAQNVGALILQDPWSNYERIEAAIHKISDT